MLSTSVTHTCTCGTHCLAASKHMTRFPEYALMTQVSVPLGTSILPGQPLSKWRLRRTRVYNVPSKIIAVVGAHCGQFV